MKRLICLVLAAVMTVPLLCACGASPEKKPAAQNDTLYLYNYGDYIDPELIPAFEKQTGIKVVMDTFDTNEIMYPVIAAGQVSYDLVIAGDYTIEKMVKNDLLQKINYANIPNSKNLSAEYMAMLAESDPGNAYGIPYTWGTVGILYNTELISSGSITSWADLFNEEYKEKGILMMDSVRDTFMVAEMLLGYSMNTTSEAELQDVVELLVKQAPLVQAYENDAARDTLITGNAALGMIYSGEYLYCLEQNENLDFCIPKEGTNVWFDCFCIPKNAKNVAAAEKFIDFMLDAENAYKTFEYLGYPIPNTAALAMISEDVKNDENVFPSQETMKSFDVYHYLGSEADELLANYWKKFRGN